MNIKIVPKEVLKYTFRIVVFFAIMHTIAFFMNAFFPGAIARKMSSAFNLDYEQNLPALFSFLQFWVVAIVLGLIAYWEFRAKSKSFRYWSTLSIIFIYLGIDELLEIHEILVRLMSKYGHFTGVLHYSWIIPVGILVAIVGLFFLRFVLQLPIRTRNGFILSGLVFVASAIGGDVISGYLWSIYGDFPNILTAIENVMEEGFEMLSIAYFLYSLLNYYHDFINEPVNLTVSKYRNLDDSHEEFDSANNFEKILLEKQSYRTGTFD